MRRALTLFLFLSLVAGSASAVIDPFYRNRMESGVRAFQQGNWEAAQRQLRLACFGHLDEPVALAEGLIRLAVVEAALGDEAAFRHIFSRLAELEERFSAYSSARVPETVRQQFENQAAITVTSQTLQATAGFQTIAQRADLKRLAALPPDKRRTEMASRLEAEPGSVNLLLEMVRLELADRRPQVALDWLDRLPAEAIALPPATCLRQQAASESASCERMDLDQPFCSDVPPTVVEFRLQCLIDAGRWPEAAELAADLSPELRARRRIARLERRVRKKISAGDGSATNQTPEITPTGAEIAAPTSALDAEPAPVEETVDPQELEPLRDRLAASATRGELADLRSAAEGLADRHPDSRAARLLAAEIAYLQSDWPATVGHFERVGDLRPTEAELAFYRAVALYESGDAVAAAEVLRPVADQLEHTNFVDTYLNRILAPGI